MNKIAFALTAVVLLAAPQLASAQSTSGGGTAGATVQYVGSVLSEGRRGLDLSSFLPGADITIAPTAAAAANVGLTFNARSEVSVTMSEQGKLTQKNPEADGNAGTAGHFTPVYTCRVVDGTATAPGSNVVVADQNCFASTSTRTLDLPLASNGRLTHRWILMGAAVQGTQTADQPAGLYEGTMTVSIKRFGT